MCRSIKKLRLPERGPTDEELRAAALQFVRKISGYHKPPQYRQQAFEQTVDDVTAVARRFFEQIEEPAAAPHG
jgi:hypothetical protein